MISFKFNSNEIIYRLPLYVLLPTSAVFYVMDFLLYRSSSPYEDIYNDVTTRFGMSDRFGIFVLAFLIGSLLLIGAIGSLIMESMRERRVYWNRIIYVTLGILCHPWVIGAVLDLLLG